MIRFLRHATRDVGEGVGWWSTWEDNDPLAEPAGPKAVKIMPKREYA